MSGPEDDDLLAAEWAFGLLDAAERAEAAARAERDPGFAALVERWQAMALELVDGGDEAPPASLWPRIDAALPANDRAGPPWRWMAGTGIAAALVAGVAGLSLRPQAPPTAPPVAPVAAHPLVALLTAPDRRAALAVSIAPDRRGLATTPVRLDLGAKAAELWVIPAGGQPRSLGVVTTGAAWRAVPAPLAAALRPGATLAVSVEPPGGSPSGKPTGPVILTATISAT